MKGRSITFLAIGIACTCTYIFLLVVVAKTSTSLVANTYTSKTFETELPDDAFKKAEYYFNTGQYADGTYDLEKAKHYYTKAIDNDTEHENMIVWYQLGRIHFLEGDYNMAISRFNKQIKYFSDRVPDVYYMLGLTYGFKAKNTKREEDWRHAEEAFKKFLATKPESVWARIDLSWVYFSQGKYAEMKTILDPAIERNAGNPWMNNMYGLALLNTEGGSQARPYFEQALEQAEMLTADNWGDVYPGNDPRSWASGIEQMRSAIAKNLELANSAQ